MSLPIPCVIVGLTEDNYEQVKDKLRELLPNIRSGFWDSPQKLSPFYVNPDFVVRHSLVKAGDILKQTKSARECEPAWPRITAIELLRNEE